jgi:hypothetical protein
MRAGLVALSLAAALGLGVGYGAAAVHADRPSTDRVHAADQLRPPQAAPSAPPVTTPTPTPSAEEPTPEPQVLWMYDTTDDRVRALEARLVQLDLMPQKWVDDYFGTETQEGVLEFQQRAGLSVTGDVDEQTWRLIKRETRTPTRAELHPAPPAEPAARSELDERCLTGRVLCVDKTTRQLSWVVDGQVQRRLDVRFGSEYTPTREGVFSVYRKSANHVSNLYGSAMPYAMFFSGGQAVHYSSDFATRGYAGASHGCVNVRDRDALARLFAQVQIGDTVVVHRS